MTKPRKKDLKALYNKVTEPKREEFRAVFDKKGKPIVAFYIIDRVPPIRRQKTSKKRK